MTPAKSPSELIAQALQNSDTVHLSLIDKALHKQCPPSSIPQGCLTLFHNQNESKIAVEAIYHGANKMIAILQPHVAVHLPRDQSEEGEEKRKQNHRIATVITESYNKLGINGQEKFHTRKPISITTVSPEGRQTNIVSSSLFSLYIEPSFVGVITCLHWKSQRHFLQFAYDVSQQIAYAHRHNIAHMDIKPANIGITKQGRFKVIDWDDSIDLQTQPIKKNFGFTPCMVYKKEIIDMHKIMQQPNTEQTILQLKEMAYNVDIFAMGSMLFQAKKSLDKNTPIRALSSEERFPYHILPPNTQRQRFAGTPKFATIKETISSLSPAQQTAIQYALAINPNFRPSAEDILTAFSAPSQQQHTLPFISQQTAFALHKPSEPIHLPPIRAIPHTKSEHS